MMLERARQTCSDAASVSRPCAAIAVDLVSLEMHRRGGLASVRVCLRAYFSEANSIVA